MFELAFKTHDMRFKPTCFTKFFLNKTDLLQTRITNWHHDFNNLFHNDKNTVYIHRFTNHLAKDIEDFGNIDVFNCEG